MDLAEMIKEVQKKDNERNKLLGQKEMVLTNLKEAGFSSITEAKKEATKMQTNVTKMEKHYDKGKEEFKKKFEHLLK